MPFFFIFKHSHALNTSWKICTTQPASLCTCHREHTLCGVVCRRRLRQCWVGWKTWASLPVKLPSWRAACVAGRGQALSGQDQIRCRSVIPARLGVTTTSTMVLHGYRSVRLSVCHKLSDWYWHLYSRGVNFLCRMRITECILCCCCCCCW